MSNRPKGREKHVTGTASVHKRGEGLNTGSVGKGRQSGTSSSGSGVTRSTGSRSLPIALILMLLFGGGGAASGLFGGNDTATTTPSSSQTTTPSSSSQTSHTINVPVAQAQPSVNTSSSSINTTSVSGARDKYTTVLGNGKDTTTIMIYMCGTDLESGSGMATSDLTEIAKASSSDQVNIIIYTGGCSKWKINGISTTVNQIYTIKDGNLYRLEDDMGSKSMVDSATLTEFIQYCSKNYPANRMDLIMWDHGGGSISGYGYDQNYKNKGSMTLTMIDKALNDAGVKFDFIGFDACLMATTENALMLADHADYLFASEETEPGIGWYYTDWLNAYVSNPSMSTVELGKNIVDTFISECSYKTSGQAATLSVIDLAEFSAAVPAKLKEWSNATISMIQNNQYQELASARQNSREFNSNQIDQCDFIDMLKKMNTTESNALADALQSAIKYNKTSRQVSNAYGVSIYFPNRYSKYLSSATTINSQIGIDEDYNSCMKEYASLQLAGQSVAYGNGNSGNPYASLFGDYGGSVTTSSDATSQILEELFYYGLNAMFSGRSMTPEQTADYITENQFDSSKLCWVDVNGTKAISLSEEQWALVTDLEENIFYDDGEGYIDLGLDNVFDFDDYGNLLAPSEKTWIAINGQVVAYYHTSTVDYGNEYSISGYVPAYLNGERVKLILTFDNENSYGYIAGYIKDYENGETETSAKLDQLVVGDVLDFVCDYYDYNGNFSNTYYLGEQMIVTDNMEISDVILDGNSVIMYKFTDIYHQEYWSETLK
ncbi:MAG: clostripain-related cysteine peptidase [Erysipelotrichaceae bacterium]|nr:clostripain-related cysteine peptidase [Erysipelotrichaceae bacterium]